MQVAWRCAICYAVQTDFDTLFSFPSIVKSGALVKLLVVNVVR